MGTMGNEGFAMAAKKICKAWIPYKMTLKINQVIPYKMKGPNPAKFSNCISRFLYDSDSILKSSILLLLQYGKVQVGSLQNGLWNGPRGQPSHSGIFKGVLTRISPCMFQAILFYLRAFPHIPWQAPEAAVLHV